MKEGWLCPRCGQINAPFMAFCSCKAEDFETKNYDVPKEDSESSTECNSGENCDHYWECIGMDTAGSLYRCRYCNELKRTCKN